MLARLARSGRFVVAVDTLPRRARAAAARPVDRRWRTRLWRLERENMIGQLREHGVPVVAWAGAGSLDLVLRDVARLASAPRAALTMLAASTGRAATGRAAGDRARATLVPLLVRCGIALCLVGSRWPSAWPVGLVASRYIGAAARWSRSAAGGRAARARRHVVAVLAVVAGWIADTSRYDDAGSRCGGCWPSPRCSTSRTPLAALAAVLPYDAVVQPRGGRPRWLGPAPASVVLVSAVLTVVALGLAAELAGAGVRGRHAGRPGRARWAPTLLLARLLRRR